MIAQTDKARHVQRIGRVLRLKAGAIEEYERYHAQVWPEVLDACRRSGVRNYTIFRYGQWLFSYFELPAGVTLESVGKVLEACEACCRWEQRMHTLQEPLPESSADNWWVPMKEVWHSNDQVQ